MLKGNEEFIRSLSDSLPFKFYMVDRDMNIVVWNKKGEEGPYGIKRADAVGKHLKEVFGFNTPRLASPKDIDGVLDEYREIFEKGTVFRTEDISVLKNGEKRYYQVTKAPLFFGGESVSHVMTIIEDLTEKRRQEAKLIVNEKLFTMRELAAGIAHQMNNPLSSIMICIESLLGDLNENEITDAGRAQKFKNYLNISYKELQRCISVLGVLAKLGSCDMDELVKTDINRLLSDMLNVLTANKKYSAYSIIKDFESGLPMVKVKENPLRQAFASIILNAFEAMDGTEAGRLRLSTAAITQNGEKMVVINFEDNGDSLEESHIKKVFSPFLNAGGNSRACLGLYVAHGIVIEHGGRIEVKSGSSEGTVFSVILPVNPKGV